MKTYTLNEALKTKKSKNLSFIKFLAALAVIISHAYPISQGKEFGDVLISFSKGHLGIGGVAVGVFFFSSGLLVSKSIEKSENLKQFLKKRCLKIFPPLIFTVILTVFLLGPIFTNMTISDYFTDLATYKYLLNAILIPIHSLPGVFENNIYGNVINGALWTLPIEFICYIALMFCYKLGLLRKKILFTFPISLIFFYLLYYSNIPIFSSISIYTLPIFIYYMGMLYYVFRDKIILNKLLAVFLIIVWSGFVYFGFAEIAMFLIFPYIFSVIVFNKKQCSEKLSELGNLSYGIYLCGFPIQQIVVCLFGGKMDVYFNMAISVVLAVVLGFVIYRICEQKIPKILISFLNRV